MARNYDRNCSIVRERASGRTLSDIASKHGISGEAVRVIVAKETNDPRYRLEGSPAWKAEVLRNLGVIPLKSDLELSTRTLNALRLNYVYLTDLCSITRAHFIRATRCVGKKTMVEIDGLMARHNLAFANPPPVT